MLAREFIYELQDNNEQGGRHWLEHLKNISLIRIGARGNTKCKELNSFLSKGEYIKNKKFY